MSPRTWQERLEDILSCARNILDFTAGMNFEAFLDSPQTIRAVAFEFTTLGEAARVMPEEIQKRYPEVPWGEILWKAAQEDIPPLIAALESIVTSNR